VPTLDRGCGWKEFDSTDLHPATDKSAQLAPGGDRIAFLSDRDNSHMVLWSITLSSGGKSLCSISARAWSSRHFHLTVARLLSTQRKWDDQYMVSFLKKWRDQAIDIR